MAKMGWFKRLFYDEPVEDSRVYDAADIDARLSADPVLVVFGTQTGAAEFIAEQTVEQLEQANITTDLVDFESLDLARLKLAKQLLIITSTTYDGEPPIMAEDFYTIDMQETANLSHLRFAQLSLGDRSYDEFCGFGKKLFSWLVGSGAQPLFDNILVDNEDEETIAHWHRYVAALAGQK